MTCNTAWQKASGLIPNNLSESPPNGSQWMGCMSTCDTICYIQFIRLFCKRYMPLLSVDLSESPPNGSQRIGCTSTCDTICYIQFQDSFMSNVLMILLSALYVSFLGDVCFFWVLIWANPLQMAGSELAVCRLVTPSALYKYRCSGQVSNFFWVLYTSLFLYVSILLRDLYVSFVRDICLFWVLIWANPPKW